MKKRRVLITGLGAVTPLGNNVNDYWKSLLEGKSAADKITKFDASNFGCQIACEVRDFNISDVTDIDVKAARRMDRVVQFAYTAGCEALTDAGLMNDFKVIDNIDKNKAGVLIGSGIGGFETMRKQLDVLDKKGPKRVSPFFIPMMISDMSSGQCSIQWGFKGPNFSISSACATGNHSITAAYHLIERGEADVMVTGGTEAAIVDAAIAGFSIAKAMSKRNDDPKTASRPFDKDRDGFVMGEGAGILILESEEHALKRGAKIYGEVLGAGMSADAFHITQPCEDGSGAMLSMTNAIRDAEINKEDVNFINAHGTSTPVGDIAEIKAVQGVFGELSKNIKINSTKSMVGHLLGAAGGVEAVAVVKSIEAKKLHPTINIFNQDPECDMDVVANQMIDYDVNVAMSNSFGFGGHNSTIVIGKYNK